MHFGLTDEQRLLQATLREFAAKGLPAPRLRDLFDADDAWDEDLWRGALRSADERLYQAKQSGRDCVVAD